LKTSTAKRFLLSNFTILRHLHDGEIQVVSKASYEVAKSYSIPSKTLKVYLATDDDFADNFEWGFQRCSKARLGSKSCATLSSTTCGGTPPAGNCKVANQQITIKGEPNTDFQWLEAHAAIPDLTNRRDAVCFFCFFPIYGMDIYIDLSYTILDSGNALSVVIV